MLSHLPLLSGLLNLNGPHRDRPLLSNDARNESSNNDSRDEEEKEKEKEAHAEEEAVMVYCSSSMEDNFMEHLPPTLHKGNLLRTNESHFKKEQRLLLHSSPNVIVM